MIGSRQLIVVASRGRASSRPGAAVNGSAAVLCGRPAAVVARGFGQEKAPPPPRAAPLEDARFKLEEDEGLLLDGAAKAPPLWPAKLELLRVEAEFIFLCGPDEEDPLCCFGPSAGASTSSLSGAS